MKTPTIYAPTAIEPALQMVRSFLDERVAAGVKFKPGESLQVSWIWFEVAAARDSLTKLTAPRFHAMPMEFIDDCSDCLNLIAKQRYVADSFKADYGWCNCVQYAVVVRDLDKCTQRFMNRTGVANEGASGWFVGAEDSTIDVNDPDGLQAVSLWELFCRCPEFGEFFLLPCGWQVVFEDRPVVLRNFRPVKTVKDSYYAKKYGC